MTWLVYIYQSRECAGFDVRDPKREGDAEVTVRWNQPAATAEANLSEMRAFLARNEEGAKRAAALLAASNPGADVYIGEVTAAYSAKQPEIAVKVFSSKGALPA